MNRFLVLFILFQSPIAWATADARFQVDPDVDVTQLEKDGTTISHVTRKGNTVTADASAVVNVPASKLLGVGYDYDQFKALGMPHVEKCASVQWDPATSGTIPTAVWCDMKSFGIESAYYLAVDVQSSLPTATVGTSAMGISWEQVSRQSGWTYPEKSSFKRFEGSFYLETLASGSTYIRYFVTTELKGGIPGFIIDLVVKGDAEKGVRQVIQIITDEARKR